uniref:Glycine N-acyltransferase-like protein n=1 Tax=Denticeps clupeoides TaxID=299321 RepID=A0AAY4E8H4_9TELE
MRRLTAEELETAEVLLRGSFPHSVMVYGHVFVMNRVKSVRTNVFVDCWPDFKILFVQPVREEPSDSFNDCAVYTKDEEIFKNFLMETEIIDWHNYFCLGSDLHHEETLNAAAVAKGVKEMKRLSACYMLTLRDPAHLHSTLVLSPLNESHVAIVNRTWKFGQDEHSVKFIRDMIRHFPTCCVLDGGQPVAWVLTYANGALGMLYTLPEHRGKGYAKVLISTLSRQLHAQGHPVFCFIERENKLSYRIFKGLGFTEEPSYTVAWFGFNSV